MTVPTEARQTQLHEPAIRTSIEVAIRLGALLLIVGWCFAIVAPFASIFIWALIIAIATSSAFEKLCASLGGRRGLSATLAVAISIALLAVPIVLLTETLISGAQNFAAGLEGGTLAVPPPPSGVREWPLVGERVFEGWRLASENLEETLARVRPQLEAISQVLLGAARSAGAGILQLLVSLVIAGFMLAHSEGRQAAIQRFAARLAGERRGPAFARLASATVQSVVQGILGVALIQAVLAGVGFIVAGIPAAGLWALLVLVAAVVQLPVVLVMIPPIAIAFSSIGPAGASLFAVWCVLVALIDNFLKPILFGRGVEVPTLVIFLGAIGGMLTMGIVGLFLGAVVLALGYELLMAWMEAPEAESAEVAASPSPGA